MGAGVYQARKCVCNCACGGAAKINAQFENNDTYTLYTGLFKVNLEFSFSIPGLFQTWNSNKPGFEKLNIRSEPGFEKLNSRSETNSELRS